MPTVFINKKTKVYKYNKIHIPFTLNTERQLQKYSAYTTQTHLYFETNLKSTVGWFQVETLQIFEYNAAK